MSLGELSTWYAASRATIPRNSSALPSTTIQHESIIEADEDGWEAELRLHGVTVELWALLDEDERLLFGVWVDGVLIWRWERPAGEA
jgi:hypothetical protein